MAVNDLTNLLYGDDGSNGAAAPTPVPAPNPVVSAPVPSSTSVAATVVPTGIGSDARFPVAPPLGWNPPPLNPVDRENLIRTIYGEASDQPPLGQAAVAHAILNRVNAGGYTGGQPNTITNVVHASVPNPRDAARGYHQFSPWNPRGVPESNPAAQNLPPTDPNYQKIGAIVDQVYSGAIPDPTGGSTHYYGYMPHPPPWAAKLAALNSTRIGGQTFIGGYAGEGQTPTTTTLAQQ